MRADAFGERKRAPAKRRGASGTSQWKTQQSKLVPCCFANFGFAEFLS